MTFRPAERTDDLPLFADRIDRASPRMHHGIDTCQAQESRLRLNGKVRRDLLNYLIAHGPRTRRELSDETGIDISSVCSTVDALRKLGAVVENGAKRNNGRLLVATPGRAAA